MEAQVLVTWIIKIASPAYTRPTANHEWEKETKESEIWAFLKICNMKTNLRFQKT